MVTMHPIQVWDFHNPISLEHLIIKISGERPKLSPNTEGRVSINWEEFCKKRPQAKNNTVAYLTYYSRESQKVITNVFTAGFSYNQYFNRDDKNMLDTQEANEKGYNPLASWILMLCDEGKYALFGKKKDFGVSGFGGFTSQEDIEKDVINPNYFINRVIKGEIGNLFERVQKKEHVGLAYYPKVSPKGFDGIFVTYIDGKPDQLKRLFKENEQFSKDLISVPADPEELINNLLNNSQFNLTRACIAGVLTFIGSKYGKDVLERALSRYGRKDDVLILETPFNGDVRELTV